MDTNVKDMKEIRYCLSVHARYPLHYNLIVKEKHTIRKELPSYYHFNQILKNNIFHNETFLISEVM